MSHIMGHTRKRKGRSLSVNIDHIATLRQVRKTVYPELLTAAGICELAGADGITIHLRGDRRHIQDRDVELIRERSHLPLTLEMALTEEMVNFATVVKPDAVTIVPERPEELTTEGGMDAVKFRDELARFIPRLRSADIEISLFLEPDPDQIKMAAELGCDSVEIHTGRYAIHYEKRENDLLHQETLRIARVAEQGVNLGLHMNAGHGIHYQNVHDLAAITHLGEFSIGHGIISRAVFTGLETAIREMSRLLHP